MRVEKSASLALTVSTLAVWTLAVWALAAPPALAWEVTWLGHAGFLVEAGDGTTLLIDPWLDNPKYPKDFKLPAKVDAILVTHGHADHASNATNLSTRLEAPIVAIGELARLLAPAGGPQPIGANVSGTVAIKGVKVTFIPAVHSSSVQQENEPALFGGNPVGFVLAARGEKTLLHAGDSGLTRDYEAVRDALKPQIALLPIGGHFTMDPQSAAIAARYLGVKDVIPMHYGTFPLLAGSPADLKRADSSLRVHELTPGKPHKL